MPVPIVHIIISSTVRYDLVEHLISKFNISRHNGDGGFHALPSQVTEKDTGLLIHRVVMEPDTYDVSLRDIIGFPRDLRRSREKLKHIKSNCHLVISVANLMVLPAEVLETCDNVYIFRQKLPSSIETLHKTYMHHVCGTAEETKMYLFKNLASSSNNYIALSDYPFIDRVCYLDEPKDRGSIEFFSSGEDDPNGLEE